MVNLGDGTTPKRRYHSPQRQLQAQLTRRKLLDAARRPFAARGYVAITLPDIAREAGMSAPTIAAVFGTKARLLTEPFIWSLAEMKSLFPWWSGHGGRRCLPSLMRAGN